MESQQQQQQAANTSTGPGNGNGQEKADRVAKVGAQMEPQQVNSAQEATQIHQPNLAGSNSDANVTLQQASSQAQAQRSIEPVELQLPKPISPPKQLQDEQQAQLHRHQYQLRPPRQKSNSKRQKHARTANRQPQQQQPIRPNRVSQQRSERVQRRSQQTSLSADLPPPTSPSSAASQASGASLVSNGSGALASSSSNAPPRQLVSPKAPIGSTTNNDFTLLLQPEFSAMTKITDHVFLTGVGGMTRSNFRKNHIDFVVNITTEAPFWENVESIRLPLEDDPNSNISHYLDNSVDRIHEAITRRNAHVLVHCVAGVSRSATIVIAYLMKYCKFNLHDAFNHCYSLRPVIRPNNGFMVQLINYELRLFGRSSVYMVDLEVDGLAINVPNFFIDEYPQLISLEVLRVREQRRVATVAAQAQAQLQNNARLPQISNLASSTPTQTTTTTTHTQPNNSTHQLTHTNNNNNKQTR